MKLFLIIAMSVTSLAALAQATDVLPVGDGHNDEGLVPFEDHIDRGFTARRAVLKDKYIGFEDLVHDVNVGPTYFNKEYGFFRAEKDGLYFFSFQFISTRRDYFRISLRVNGHPQVWAQAQRNYQQAGSSATLYLNQGDVVYCYLEDGAVFEPRDSYRGYGTFNGHRITYNETPAVVPRTTSKRLTAEQRKEVDDYAKVLDNIFVKP